MASERIWTDWSDASRMKKAERDEIVEELIKQDSLYPTYVLGGESLVVWFPNKDGTVEVFDCKLRRKCDIDRRGE